VTEALTGADELANDRADEAEAHVEAQRREEVWLRVRHAQLPEDLAPRRVHALEELEGRRLDAAHSGDAVHQHRIERRERGDDRLRHDREAEPDDEDRRDGDHRRRADRHDDRVERLLGESRVHHDDREHKTHQRADDEPHAGLDERDVGVVEDPLGRSAEVLRRDEPRLQEAPQRADDRARRG
jgi:hypothetical protein